MEDIEKCVEKLLSREMKDDVKFQVVKSLCWMKQANLAKQVLMTLKSPEDLPILDKALVKEIFKINYLNLDEK